MALYENIAEFYDEIFPLKQTRLDFIASFLENNSEVLDIGCATGELALALSKRGWHPRPIIASEVVTTIK